MLSTVAFAQEYASVPTEQERKVNPQFKRLPDWRNLEFVKLVQNGLLVVDQNLVSILHPQLWNKEVHLQDLKWLALDNFDIYLPDIRVNQTEAIIPFAVDVRFIETPLWLEGTLNTWGYIHLLLEKGKVIQIEVVKFRDSNLLENLGRHVLGTIDQFDANFARDVVQSGLLHHFSNATHLKTLMGVLPNVSLQKP